MSSGAAALSRPTSGRRRISVAGLVSRALRWPHLPGLSVQLALGLWLCRGFASSAIPAGTDTLGFVARAASNARADTWLSAWSPESLGAPRTITLESLLGVLTKGTGDPVFTVKAFMLATLVASGAGAYWLTWRWYRTRLGAAVAGLLYMASQISLAQTASGHLNVCVILALAPAIIGLTVEGVEQFSLKRATLLGAALALLILARPDMALYVVPLAALYVPVHGVANRRLGEAVRNGARTAAVALIVALALSLYAVVPLLAGVRAEWVSSGGLFSVPEFQARSVPALASMLGFAREIGYLAFTGRQTWTSHPWLSFGAYVALAEIPVAAAWSALALRRDARTLYLLLCAVVAPFAAKGMYGPIGGPYRWAVEHVPLFGNLRDPNRWLIVGSLAVAVLAGVTAARLPTLLRWLRATRPAKILIAAAAIALVALPTAPTLLPGLATWSPTPGQARLLADAASGDSALATVPFDQTRRYLTQGSYQGWEHDLGSESSLWTGRPALGDGDWSQSSSATVSYLTTLLGRRDPAYAPMLSGLGVGNVLSFNYAPTAPGLANATDPHYQQQAIASMSDLAPVHRTGAGTLLKVPGAAGVLSARPLNAVILGGRSGLRAFVRLHGVVPSQWAAEDASALLNESGLGGLLASIRDADLVVVADASVGDLAVLSAPPLAQFGGISSDLALAAATQTLLPDVASRTGTLIDESALAPEIGQHQSSSTFLLSRPQPAGELWAQIRALPNAATLRFSIDGRPVGSITPVAAVAAGFSWVRVATSALAPGVHKLDVTAVPSAYGDAYELNALRELSRAQRQQAQQELALALRRAAPRTAYAADLADAVRTADPAQFRPAAAIGGGVGYWKTLEPQRTAVSHTGTSATIAFRAGRRYHTLAAHYFRTPRDWSSHAFLFVRVRGHASGAVFRILVDGDAHHRYTNPLVWTDNEAGWRLIAVPLLADPAVSRHIVSLRVATDDNQRAGRLELGTLSLSPAISRVAVHLPIPSQDRRRVLFVDQPSVRTRYGVEPARTAGGHPGGSVSVKIPLSKVGLHYLVLAPPAGGVPRAASPALSWNRYGANRFSFKVRARRPFTLVLARSQDTHWHLTGVPGAVLEQEWGTLQGWRLPAGTYSGSISYQGDDFVRFGLAVSMAIALGIATLMIPGRRSAVRRPLRSAPDSEGRLPVCLRDLWPVPWVIALSLLVVIPIASVHGPGATGDSLAVAATGLMVVAVALAALRSRRQ